jgi:hypothetical protein
MSIICLNSGDYTRAELYNDQALELMEVGVMRYTVIDSNRTRF